MAVIHQDSNTIRFGGNLRKVHTLARFGALAGILLLQACAASARAPKGTDAWTVATRSIRVGLEWRLTELQFQGAKQESGTDETLIAAVKGLASDATRCISAWGAFEDYAQHAGASLTAAPYEPNGIEEQVMALSELHRRLICSGALADDPLSFELAARSAREMRSARDTTAAFAGAEVAIRLLAEEVALAHFAHAAAVTEASAAAVQSAQTEEDAARTAIAAYSSELAALEDELRMEAAGAGRARPEAAKLAADVRTALAAAQALAEAAGLRRAKLLVAFDQYREQVQKSGQAARAWAVAQREMARATRAGLAQVNLSLLQHSAEELAAP